MCHQHENILIKNRCLLVRDKIIQSTVLYINKKKKYNNCCFDTWNLVNTRAR